jgi:hypothetical protein
MYPNLNLIKFIIREQKTFSSAKNSKARLLFSAARQHFYPPNQQKIQANFSPIPANPGFVLRLYRPDNSIIHAVSFHQFRFYEDYSQYDAPDKTADVRKISSSGLVSTDSPHDIQSDTQQNYPKARYAETAHIGQKPKKAFYGIIRI